MQSLKEIIFLNLPKSNILKPGDTGIKKKKKEKKKSFIFCSWGRPLTWTSAYIRKVEEYEYNALTQRSPTNSTT